jgi:hypothetical protein
LPVTGKVKRTVLLTSFAANVLVTRVPLAAIGISRACALKQVREVRRSGNDLMREFRECFIPTSKN